MPDAATIVAELGRIADQAFFVAVVWHVVLAAGIVGLAVGWRPSRRAAAYLLILPLGSVASAALAFHSPFNATVVAALCAALLFAARRLEARPVSAGPRWAVVLGVGMVTFAWLYPHFLVGRDALAYFYGAPIGLLPCPTLAMVIGLTLLADGLGSTSWTLLLGAAGAFYGLFGAWRLGVTIDIALVVGACAVVGLELRRRGGHRLGGHRWAGDRT